MICPVCGEPATHHGHIDPPLPDDFWCGHPQCGWEYDCMDGAVVETVGFHGDMTTGTYRQGERRTPRLNNHINKRRAEMEAVHG